LKKKHNRVGSFLAQTVNFGIVKVDKKFEEVKINMAPVKIGAQG